MSKAVTGISSRKAILAMTALCAAVFVAALDQTMVLTVMPSIMRSLYIDLAHLNDVGWIITGYLLGYTVAMPLFGRRERLPAHGGGGFGAVHGGKRSMRILGPP